MVWLYIMFWANTWPSPEATTDLGVMAPPITLTFDMVVVADGALGRAAAGEGVPATGGLAGDLVVVGLLVRPAEPRIANPATAATTPTPRPTCILRTYTA